MTPVRTEEIQFESAGRRLSGRLFRPVPTGARGPGMLFIHGLGSSQTGYFRRGEAVSRSLSAVCLTFDLGGHGDGGEAWRELTPHDHLQDVVAALDALRAGEDVDADRIGVCGASYGGYLAALLTSERPVKRLLLRAPAVYADDEIDVPIGRHEGRANMLEAGVFTCLGAFRGDVLVVESQHDCVIPPSVIERYVASTPRASRVVIAGAGHALDPRFEPEFVKLIRDWFREL